MQPDVLILDEPLAGLDLPMQQELLQLHADGVTLIVATHDMDFAYQWADRIAVMVDGKCSANFDTHELPGALEQLNSYGIGTPKVAELYQVLVVSRILKNDAPIPRSYHTLKNMLTK